MSLILTPRPGSSKSPRRARPVALAIAACALAPALTLLAAGAPRADEEPAAVKPETLQTATFALG